MFIGLIWAAGRGFSEVVKVLLDAGAKVDVGDKVSKPRFVNCGLACLPIFVMIFFITLLILVRYNGIDMGGKKWWQTKRWKTKEPN